MVRRLVLGCGSLGHGLTEDLADRQGSISVVTRAESRADTLRDAGIAVTVGDPADPGVVDGLEADPDLVLIAADDGAQNLAVAEVARAAFPSAYLLAYAGAERAAGDELGRYVDRVVDPTDVLATHVVERVGDVGGRMHRLRRVLGGIDHLGIFTHDNPDPDAIASALALSRIAARVGCAVDVCYYGEITHQENRAMVNLLDLDLANLEPDADISAYDGVALVDHSRPGVNDQLPPNLTVDVVIDHHPPRAPVEGRFVDLRGHVGATSTLLVEYLDHFGVTLDGTVATALLFGIRVDTDEFTREVSPEDFEAAARLLPTVDLGVLERIESPQMSPETLETIAAAIRNRRHEGEVLLSGVGRLTDRDALAQSADRLLGLEGVSTTVVYGVKDGTIYVSARSRGSGVDLGETLRDAFGQIGSAGGHADMAGAQVTMGVLEAVEDQDESLTEIVETVVSNRFLEALAARADRPPTAVLPADPAAAEEYLVPAEERDLDPEDLDSGVEP